jgi:hypothetical protein
MTEVLVRQEIHNLIDNISESKLYALRPILNVLVDEEYDEDDVLSEEEALLLEECRKDLKEHPERLTSWRKVRRESLV